MTELFTPDELADIVDTLATIRAHIADETARADTYRDCLIAAKVDAVDGTLHRATITSTTPTATDWQAIAHALAWKLAVIDADRKSTRLNSSH